MSEPSKGSCRKSSLDIPGISKFRNKTCHHQELQLFPETQTSKRRQRSLRPRRILQSFLNIRIFKRDFLPGLAHSALQREGRLLRTHRRRGTCFSPSPGPPRSTHPRGALLSLSHQFPAWSCVVFPSIQAFPTWNCFLMRQFFFFLLLYCPGKVKDPHETQPPLPLACRMPLAPRGSAQALGCLCTCLPCNFPLSNHA